MISEFLANAGLMNSVLQSKMEHIFSDFINNSIALFVMVDPFAALPIYLLLAREMTMDELHQARRKGCLVATGILIFFLVLGVKILDLLAISVPALRVAGGCMLLQFTFQHLAGSSSKSDIPIDAKKDDPTIVPFAIPVLAGPGAISLVIVKGSYIHDSIDMLIYVLSIICVMLITYFLLKYSARIMRLMGETGLKVFTKLMVLLVAAISIEFILSGLKAALPGLDILK
jgi:multiple antibiotic resistance protein